LYKIGLFTRLDKSKFCLDIKNLSKKHSKNPINCTKLYKTKETQTAE